VPGERSAGDFGGKLREARERKGVTLRQIAAATKISIGVLEALERNDISRLPGGIFSRAFVRSYAIEVGLDPETTIQDFIAAFPQDSVTAGHPRSTDAEDHEAIESDRRTATTFVRLVLISVPIVGAMLYFATAGRHVMTAEKPAAPAPTRAPAAEPPPEPEPSARGVSPPSVGDPAAPAATSTAAAPAAPPADERLTIGVSARRPCWVSATVDGQKKIERLLQSGEQTTLEVRREMVLTAGDASAIALTLNGADARPLGKAGEVVTTRVNLSNYKDYLQSR
jgi:cytoskeletal protein RodZ